MDTKIELTPVEWLRLGKKKMRKGEVIDAWKDEDGDFHVELIYRES